jgi:two-component system CheB/CheR fusion protein
MTSIKKDRQSKLAAKENATGLGSRAGGSERPVIVVGVGTSARELTSLKRLLVRMPLGRGLAFVVIQHPGRSHTYRTIEKLGEQNGLPVVDATNGMPVLADRVHVVPAGKFLSITQGRLSLHEPENCDGLHMPVDYFLCTLAADQRNRSCGILLAGPSRDGTLGLSEIKAAGGRTIVQTPGGARIPNMPQSAIDAGVADAVLAPDDMAAAVLDFAAQVSADTCSRPAEPPQLDADLRPILDTLRTTIGHDFRCYKPTTLLRRIRRRMAMANLDSYGEYAHFLNEHPEEVSRLQKDLLIGVTEFFRQPQAWEFLAQKVIAGLVENAEPDTVLRLWVPACASGQEAYSLAMLMSEQVERPGKKVDFQLFATDTDHAALAKARTGVYSEEEIGPNVSPERRRRFFTLKDSRHQAVKALRERIVFAPQNLTADPPFSRLDLVSCRNLLIYIEPPVQKKLIALFHFALRNGGFLFLGSVETVGDREDLFAPVSKKWRIYRRIGVGRRTEIEIPVQACEASSTAAKLPAPIAAPRLSLAAAARQALLERFSPACVLVDRKLQVLYTHGAVERYLAFPTGELTTNVVTMAREGLRVRLRGAVGKCIEAGKSVAITARVRRAHKSVPVRAFVSLMHYPRETDGLLLIAFEDIRISAAASRKLSAGESGMRQLEDELRITREELQSSIEQLESSNDQLKASNEEVTAANEELQSANEELETSKEELQSLNEELNTINFRLQEKVDEQEAITNDVVNLLASTYIATVFLDKELRVKRYTPAITRLLSLIPTDVGRPMVDILRHFRDDALLDDAAKVLADLTPLATEVLADDGRWYIRRITPYRTKDDRIEGAVITFVDVSDLKSAERRLHDSEERYRLMVEAIKDYAIFMLDPQGRVSSWNAGAERLTGWSADETLGQDFSRFYPDEAVRRGEPRRELDMAAAKGRYEEQGWRTRKDGSGFLADVTITSIQDEFGTLRGFAQVARDITEQKRTEEQIQSAALFLEENPFPIFRVGGDGGLLYANLSAARLLEIWGCRLGTPVPEFMQRKLATALGSGTPQELEARSSDRDLSFVLVPIVQRNYVNFYGRDITERKEAEDRLRLSEESLRQANESMEQRVQERTTELKERAEQLVRLSSQLTMAEQRERKRLAQTLHDGLQQYLMAAKMQLGGLIEETSDAALKQTLNEVENLLGESIRVSRSLAAELTPPILHEAGLLAGLEWLSRWMSEKHGLKVELVIQMDAPILTDDVKVLVFESVRELLLNVVKHARTLSATVSLFQKDLQSLQITVSDNGQGFDPAGIAVIGAEGEGFGLFSIRERISLICGRFEVDSSPGAGARFILTAPLAINKPLESMSCDQSLEVDPTGVNCLPTSGGKIRILLADDHSVMREGLARLLSQETDFEVVGQASDGQEAVALAANLLPDVILMDISMPRMNGIEATRMIHQKHPNIRIIGLSLYQAEERGKAMLDSGAVIYLTKSGPPANLKAAIRSCLNEKSQSEMDITESPI